MMSCRFAASLVLVSATGLIAGRLQAEDSKPSASQIEFFEREIRPLLSRRCFKCHSVKAKVIKGGLRLDSRARILKGGDSGPAIVVGKPDSSPLIKAVRYQTSEMPPNGKLKPGEIAALTKWVKIGAPWPKEITVTGKKPSDPKTWNWANLRKGHWSFRAVRKPAVARVRTTGWVRNDLDRFILSRLERRGLRPSPPAEPRVLIRRLSFDLIGLPPSPREVEEFIKAARNDRGRAVRDAVDRLLQSQQYGERWARHWLDVARYSDGFGGFLDNRALPNAWRYRDWVVSSFNRDEPYDRFVKLQIAGDLMEKPSDAVATGFFALGPTYRSDGGDPDSKAQALGETLDDRVDTLSRGFLAITVSCARCHDHKFDPIPQMDYYSLAGVFQNTRLIDLKLADAKTVQNYDDHQKQIRETQQRINKTRNLARKQKRKPTAEEAAILKKWTAELDKLRKTVPKKYPVAHGLADSGNRDMRVALRGNLRKPGPPAPRRFLRILSSAKPRRFMKGSGRLELADAIADRANPLTARVIVNRIWMHHFGRPIVGTPSNFGKTGEKPSHPLLLDWLASKFMGSGWSIKKLHRLILLSATWQQSSRFNAANHRVDADNRMLWRMNPRRLDVEAWRDAVLSVSGELDLNRGGPPTEDINSKRRTLYLKSSRNGDRFGTDGFLRLFDFPLMRATVAKRPESIVPQQYLFLLNSAFMKSRSHALTKRLMASGTSNRKRIIYAYALLYSRKPTSAELKLGVEFLRFGGKKEPSQSAWRQYAQVLQGANEFRQIR